MYRDYDYPPAWMSPKSFTGWEILRGFLTVFIVIPLLFIGLFALIVLILVAIAVPPVGVALLARS